MAKYVVIYEGKREDVLDTELLRGHVDHLRDLNARGILFLCGPLKGSGGKALLIFEAGSQEEVESCVLKDPFIIQKWYSSYSVSQWIEANDSNNYLMDKC